MSKLVSCNHCLILVLPFFEYLQKAFHDDVIYFYSIHKPYINHPQLLFRCNFFFSYSLRAVRPVSKLHYLSAVSLFHLFFFFLFFSNSPDSMIGSTYPIFYFVDQVPISCVYVFFNYFFFLFNWFPVVLSNDVYIVQPLLAIFLFYFLVLDVLAVQVYMLMCMTKCKYEKVCVCMTFFQEHKNCE